MHQIHDHVIMGKMAVLLTPQLGQLFFFVGGKGQRLHSQPKTSKAKQQEKVSGGGSERLFVIMVQIQTCWWVWGSAHVSWRYPRWPAPPVPISGPLAVPARRAQTADLGMLLICGTKKKLSRGHTNVLEWEPLFFFYTPRAGSLASSLKRLHWNQSNLHNKVYIQSLKMYLLKLRFVFILGTMIF